MCSAVLNMFSQVGSVKKAWFFQEGKQRPGESWQMIISRGCWWKAENKLPFFSFIMQQVHLFPPLNIPKDISFSYLVPTRNKNIPCLKKKKKDLLRVYSVQIWAQEHSAKWRSLELVLVSGHIYQLALKNSILGPDTWGFSSATVEFLPHGLLQTSRDHWKT